MVRTTHLILATLVGLSVVVGIYEVVLYLNEYELSAALQFIWTIVFIILVVLWVNEDSKSYQGVYRPFDFGYLVFLFYFLYVPYYLFKTRGALGLAYLTVLFILFKIGWLLSWTIYWLN